MKAYKIFLGCLVLGGLGAYAEAPIPRDTKTIHYKAVTVPTVDGLTLHGHLALPRNLKEPVPAVLFLVGSGAGNRYENVPASMTADGKPSLLFKPIEEALVERGIAVLTYDKRGVTPKDNSFMEDDVDASVFATADADHLAADARKAFEVLLSQPEVDTNRLGLLGHSEGTVLALKVAEAYPQKVKNLFMLGLLSRSFKEIMDYQNIDNNMRTFYKLDDNDDSLLTKEEYLTATASDPVLGAELGSYQELLLPTDRNQDQVLEEQEWRYFLETQTRGFYVMVADGSQPWPLKTPREWFQQYFAEGPFLNRHKVFCSRIHLFQGEIDIQTPYEDALELVDACKSQGTPLASFHRYPLEGHAFSPRIGYKK